MSRLKMVRMAAWLGGCTVLLAVFAAYLKPEVAMTLANQLWSCF